MTALLKPSRFDLTPPSRFWHVCVLYLVVWPGTAALMTTTSRWVWGATSGIECIVCYCVVWAIGARLRRTREEPK